MRILIVEDELNLWVYGMVVCTDKGIFKFTWSKDDFYLVDKPIEKRNVGYPLT